MLDIDLLRNFYKTFTFDIITFPHSKKLSINSLHYLDDVLNTEKKN